MTPRSAIRRAAGLLLVLVLLTAAGCKSWDWRQLRGPGLASEKNWSSGIRASESTGKPAGLSQMSRDIERNLGVH